MASELAPRLQLVAILRSVLLVFSVFALLNGQSYIGEFYRQFSEVRAAFAVSWVVVAWNVVCVVAVAVHPHLQRLADGLPFPIKVTVRGKTILAYGDHDENGDGLFAPLTAKLSLAFLDVVLATLVLVFMIQSQDKTIDCVVCIDGPLHVQEWVRNIWLTILIFEYALALFQSLEAASIWYKQRYINNRGHISLA
ncbi:hypothetical protein PG999_008923 [Apiospora kogelbergensis]|uniref:Uncharacterized protein n=1 Tax=Apiospora kogelbergensis TaxID=1337665 RepID=A0AAW0QJ91_9PEZI